MSITIMSERDAKHAETVTHTATISERDAWGNETHYDIEWMPKVVWDVALGHENIGQVPVAWADTCPVWAVRSNIHGNVVLHRDVRQVAFERATVVDPWEVDSADALEPGCYRVVREW